MLSVRWFWYIAGLCTAHGPDISLRIKGKNALLILVKPYHHRWNLYGQVYLYAYSLLKVERKILSLICLYMSLPVKFSQAEVGGRCLWITIFSTGVFDMIWWSISLNWFAVSLDSRAMSLIDVIMSFKWTCKPSTIANPALEFLCDSITWRYWIASMQQMHSIMRQRKSTLSIVPHMAALWIMTVKLILVFHLYFPLAITSIVHKRGPQCLFSHNLQCLNANYNYKLQGMQCFVHISYICDFKIYAWIHMVDF